jgi:suppressor of tumorigenicity protein 13
LERCPEEIHRPELQFFRVFLQKYGAKIPSPETCPKKSDTVDDVVSDDSLDEESAHSSNNDVEESSEDSGRMEPEEYVRQEPLTDNFLDMTDEEVALVSSLKDKLCIELEKSQYKEALDTITEILQLGNPTAMLYAKRAEINLKLKKPLSCIADCDKALMFNPDNGKAYRLRGCAYRALGNWERSYKDLEIGQNIDYDDSLDEMQKFVSSKWKLIDTKQRAKQRRREERRQRNLLRERRRRQAAAKKAYEAANNESPNDSSLDDVENNSSDTTTNQQNCFNFGASNTGASNLGGLGGLLGDLMSNPAAKKAMSNPKILQAVMEMIQNPSSFSKYKDDPEIMSAFTALMSSMKNTTGGFDKANANCDGFSNASNYPH